MSGICENNSEEKLHMNNSEHILSYLSFLEKFYEQSLDKSRQERLFRINKAINSIKKYSNCQVSSFNFNPVNTSPSENVNISNIKENNNPKKIGVQDNGIDDILHLIEKELKQSGINESDINNSLLSTSKKSLNSDSEPNKIDSNNNESLQNVAKTNINQKRLSKLFLKIELKLKTFIQEDDMKKALMKQDNDSKTLKNEENKEDIKIFSIGDKAKSPSKLPDVLDSFFSNKNKVNSILKNVKRQRRKSVIEFNNKYFPLTKDDKNEYINDSPNSKSPKENTKKRKKTVPCSAIVVMRHKTTKKTTSEKISNFCDMIDEKEEDREELDDIKAFNKDIGEEDLNVQLKKDNNQNMKDDKFSFNIQDDSSIKIMSSINNRNIHLNSKNNPNEHVTNNNNINEESPSDNPYMRKSSIFNQEKNNEAKEDEKSEGQYPLLDDEILMEDSYKKDNFDSLDEESNSNSKKSDSSSKSINENNSKGNEEKYDMIKFINDSKKRTAKINEEPNGKCVSNFGKSIKDEDSKNEVQREIERASNINRFCMNSILSPLKNVDIRQRENEMHKIEEFSKFS